MKVEHREHATRPLAANLKWPRSRGGLVKAEREPGNTHKGRGGVWPASGNGLSGSDLSESTETPIQDKAADGRVVRVQRRGSSSERAGGRSDAPPDVHAVRERGETEIIAVRRVCVYSYRLCTVYL